MNNSYLNIYEKIKKYCDYSYESKMFCVNKRKLLNHFFATEMNRNAQRWKNTLSIRLKLKRLTMDNIVLFFV